MIVREEASKYLLTQLCPSTRRAYELLNSILKSVEYEGMNLIWDVIKGPITSRVLFEYAALCSDDNDPRLVVLINKGINVKLTNTQPFEDRVINSLGYFMYKHSIEGAHPYMGSLEEHTVEKRFGFK